MNIYLVGYMFSGKSTIGRKLAHRLGFNFVDTDDLFEKKHQISIPDYFEKEGEAKFRLLEKDILYETIELQKTVIATGGGMPCFSDNMTFINANGISVYLQAHPNTILYRMQQADKERPILESIAKEQRLDFIKEQLELRNHFYTLAQITYKSESIHIEDLVGIIKRKCP